MVWKYNVFDISIILKKEHNCFFKTYSIFLSYLDHYMSDTRSDKTRDKDQENDKNYGLENFSF